MQVIKVTENHYEYAAIRDIQIKFCKSAGPCLAGSNFEFTDLNVDFFGLRILTTLALFLECPSFCIFRLLVWLLLGLGTALQGHRPLTSCTRGVQA